MSWLIGLGILIAVAGTTSGLAAASFAWIGGLVLGMSAKLLDIAMYALVARFDTVIFGFLSPVINQLWTAFRDISNIIIIGMFTFIAISMIIGMQSFGTRKMIARVLIIAVLINFSLLFGRIVIESSNFVARQFYCAMIVSAGSDACTNGSSGTANLAAVGNSNNGIGLQFMTFLGAKDFTTARETANKIYYSNASVTALGLDGGFYALFYGLAVAVLMIAAAAVFAYIVLLLVARAILFLFLLVMSAPAFAAYLIPKYGDQYWSMWWNSLLRNAVFGPLLMMLLWATFLFSRGLSQSVAQGGSFDTLFSNQASGSGYLALLVFAIILGMLFASARFASSFAKSVGGLSMSQLLAASPLTLGSRFLAAPLARRFIGRPAYSAAKAAGDAAENASKDASLKRSEVRHLDFSDPVRVKAEKEARKLDLQARDASRRSARFGAIADSKMNVMDSKLAQSALKGMGISGLAAGASSKGTESAAKTIKDRAEEAGKRAAELVVSENDARKIATKAVEKDTEERATSLKAVREEANRELEGTKLAVQKSHKDEIERLQTEISKAATDEQGGIQKRIAATNESEMRSANERIKQARETADRHRAALQNINAPVADAEQKLERAKDEIRKFGREVNSEVDRMTKEIRNKSIDAAVDIAPGLVQRRILGVPVGRGVPSKSLEGKGASSKVKSLVKTQRIREQFEAGKEFLGSGAPPPAAE